MGIDENAGGAVGRVQVVVDDTACISPEDAGRLGITVVDLPLNEEGGEASTSAIGPLHLCAAYARALERGGDAGVVALHVGKGLSSTYSNAVTAAAVLDRVRVVDTSLVGAGLGAAAVAAAETAHAGGDLDACVAAAESVGKRNHLWLYVPKLDALRRGGRISAGQAMLSTALSIKPVIGLQDGTLGLVAKCRTEGKVLNKLVDLASAAAQGRPAQVFLHHADALDVVEELAAMLSIELADGTSFRILDIPPALLAHTGPGAVGVALVTDESVGGSNGEGAGSGADTGVDSGDRDGGAAGGGGLGAGGDDGGNRLGGGGAAGAGFFGKLAKGAGGAGGAAGARTSRSASEKSGRDSGDDESGASTKSSVPHIGWSSGWTPGKARSTGAAGAAAGGGLSSGLGSGAKRAKALGVEPVDLSDTAQGEDGAGGVTANGAAPDDATLADAAADHVAVGDAHSREPDVDAVTGAAIDAAADASDTADTGADSSDTDATDTDGLTVLAPEDPEPVAPLFTTVTSKLPHWSENRRAAKEKAERLAKAIADLSRRDKSDPEGAAFAEDAKEEAARLAAERAENGGNGTRAEMGDKTGDKTGEVDTIDDRGTTARGTESDDEHPESR